MARSSGRAKPYVVEIQRHYYLDEFDRKEKKGQHIRPPVAPRNPSIPPQLRSSGRRPHKEWASKPRHVPLDPSRLNRGSLEYEDIYNERNRSGENPHLKQQGRWSFRDDRGYGRVREHTRRSPGIARPTEMTLMNGKIIDREDNTEKRQQNGIVSDTGHMRAHYKEAHVSTSRDAPSHEQSRVTKDKNDDHRDDLELWIARQTSFPKKQDGMVEMSNQRIVGNSTHDLVSNQSDSKQSNSNQSSSVHEKSGNFLLPSVALKPGRSHTPRSASPALSVRSSQSGASHVSHHSARSGTSEVSVKSILKKPKVGRVVLKEEPSSYKLCAVLSCILCFPFGIYALIKSNQVNGAVEENDYESALSSSRKVKSFCFGVLLAYVGILAVAGALLGVYFTTGKIF